MKKLSVLGLIAVSIVTNIIAMEPPRRQIHSRDRIGQAHQKLNRIIDAALPVGPTDWKAIFIILDSMPHFINTYITPTDETLLEYALEEKNFAVAKRLLQQYHADPYRVVTLGDKTPLQIARKFAHEAGAQEIINLLESYGDEARVEGYGNLLEGYGNESGQ